MHTPAQSKQGDRQLLTIHKDYLHQIKSRQAYSIQDTAFQFSKAKRKRERE